MGALHRIRLVDWHVDRKRREFDRISTNSSNPLPFFYSDVGTNWSFHLSSVEESFRLRQDEQDRVNRFLVLRTVDILYIHCRYFFAFYPSTSRLTSAPANLTFGISSIWSSEACFLLCHHSPFRAKQIFYIKNITNLIIDCHVPHHTCYLSSISTQSTSDKNEAGHLNCRRH